MILSHDENSPINNYYISDHFHKALELMNRAVTQGQQPGALESVSYLTNMENLPPPPPPPRIDVSKFNYQILSVI